MDFIEQFRPYRPLLWGLSVVGFFGINGVFLYYALLHPTAMVSALQNPISAAFIVEALLMTAVFAWIVWLTGAEKPGYLWFIVLSVVGSLAFSVPAFLLLHMRKSDRKEDGVSIL